MKYSEAKSRIEEILDRKYGDEWSDHYRFEDWESYFALSKRDDTSKMFKVILWVSKEDPGCFEARKLGRSEKPMADIFMELALTPLEEREEEKKYVVKIWDHEVGSFILVKDRISHLLTISATHTIDKINQAGGPGYEITFTKKEIEMIKDTFTSNIDWDKAVEEYDGEI